MVEKPDLRIKIRKLLLKNPVLVASGTFGFGEEFSSFLDLNLLGGVVTKTITLKPKEGNPPPRLVETPCGLLNSIGLENPGVENFLRNHLPFLRRFNTCIIVSIGGESFEEYVELTRILEKEKVEGVELNLSCPNVNKGGIYFGKNPREIFSLVKEVRKVTSSTLIAKLTPYTGEIEKCAFAAEAGGADALSLINTFPALSIDVETQKPRLGNVTGGLSGPAIRPIAVKMVWEVYRRVNLPLIGMGGIMEPEDALEFILAGARAVAIGTANFIDPHTPLKIVKGIENWLIRKGVKKVTELVGKIKK